MWTYVRKYVKLCTYVHLCPTLSGRIRRVDLKNHKSKFHEIFYKCHLWPWLSPRLMTVQYVMYFRFCGWRRVFRQTRVTDVVFSSSPGGGTGSVVAQRSCLQLQTCYYGMLERFEDLLTLYRVRYVGITDYNTRLLPAPLCWRSRAARSTRTTGEAAQTIMQNDELTTSGREGWVTNSTICRERDRTSCEWCDNSTAMLGVGSCDGNVKYKQNTRRLIV